MRITLLSAWLIYNARSHLIQLNKISDSIIPILCTRKMENSETKQLAQDHRTGNVWSQDSNPHIQDHYEFKHYEFLLKSFLVPNAERPPQQFWIDGLCCGNNQPHLMSSLKNGSLFLTHAHVQHESWGLRASILPPGPGFRVATTLSWKRQGDLQRVL